MWNQVVDEDGLQPVKSLSALNDNYEGVKMKEHMNSLAFITLLRASK